MRNFPLLLCRQSYNTYVHRSECFEILVSTVAEVGRSDLRLLRFSRRECISAVDCVFGSLDDRDAAGIIDHFDNDPRTGEVVHDIYKKHIEELCDSFLETKIIVGS